MASGFLATFAYVVFEGSLIGGCAYFANDAVNTVAGVNVPWLMFAIAAIVVIGALCHFHISLTAAILGVTLVSEVILLLALALSVIVKGGGPDGLLLDQTVLLLNKAFESLPEGAFGTAAAAGSMAIGPFFAFWSWVGFETTAVYGEESRNPKTIIPRATLIAVIGMGLFYTFVSAMVLAGNGAKLRWRRRSARPHWTCSSTWCTPIWVDCCSTSTRSCSSSDPSPARWRSTTPHLATCSRSAAKSLPPQ